MATDFQVIFSSTGRNALVDYSELPGTGSLQGSPAAVPAFALLNNFKTILEESTLIERDPI